MTSMLEDNPAREETRRRLAQLRGLGAPAMPPAMPAAAPVAPLRAPLSASHTPWAWGVAGVATAVAAAAVAVAWPAWRASPAVAVAAPTAAASSTVGAATAPAVAVPGGAVLEASGFVVAGRQATVSASTTGRIAKLYVAEGQQVRRGELIAELDAGIPAAQVAYAQAGVLAAERSVEVTRRKLAAAHRSAARDQDLATQGFISRASLDQSSSNVEAMQAQLDAEISQVAVAREQQRIQAEQMASVRVRAPFDGVVTGVSAREGEIVSPISGGGGFTRTGICTLLDEASLEGEVDVNERYLARLHVGQRVQVRLPAYPAVVFEGRVADLPTSIDRNTSAARLRIRFVQRVPQLRTGMRADFAFERT
jgi:RND family efflux transporter MFP subunit